MNTDTNDFTGVLPNDCRASRPRVNAKNPDLNALTLNTWNAIMQANDPPELFNREGTIVHIPSPQGSELITCQPADMNRLRWWLTKRLYFFQTKSDTEIPARPPNDLLTNLLATPNPPLPKLVGVVRHPIFAQDGTLQVEPGYSARTQRYYVPDAALLLRPVSPRPTPQEIEQAKQTLLGELLVDFSFVGDSSVAHALGALLLPFVRPLVGPTPLHLISKHKAGSGATLLAEVLCIPSGGFVKITLPQQEEERRRTLLSVLRDLPGAVVLDNVSSLEGAALASCLTEEVFEDRQIGSSRLLRVPNTCLWQATGNNPDLSDEIARRTVPIHLDPKVEHPDLRTGFKHPLPKWALEHRAELVWSALTLCQAWIAAGKPQGMKTLGKFETWSAVVGGILQVAGVPGFLERLEEFRRRTDAESSLVRGFVEAWAESFQDQSVRVANLLPLASSLDLGNGNERSRGIRLGKLLSDRQGQHFGPWRIEKRGMISGNQHWGLSNVGDGGGSGGSGGYPPSPPIDSHSNPTLGVSTTSTTSTQSRRNEG